MLNAFISVRPIDVDHLNQKRDNCDMGPRLQNVVKTLRKRAAKTQQEENEGPTLTGEQITLSQALPNIKFADTPKTGPSNLYVLKIVVDYLKSRHLDGIRHPLSVPEILEETPLHNLPVNTVKWLESEALANNPKIGISSDGKFYYKPKYNIRDRKDLYNLLKEHHIQALWAVRFNDVADCVKNADDLVKVRFEI